MKINHFLLLVGLLFTTALTFSCSTESNDSGSNNFNGSDGGGEGSDNTMYTLTVDVSPYGAGTVSPAQASYAPGTQAIVTATPASGYTFSHWSGASNSTSNPLSITMNNDEILTAVFEPMYTLTVEVSPYGAGTVNPAQASYAPGTQATVTATPASGYTFSHWSGASNSTSNPLNITMNSNKTLTAVFEQVANAVIITLTYWESKETDGALGSTKLDPKIWFEVEALQGGKSVSNNSTSALLDKTDLGQSWSGSSKSSAIPFIPSADELRIYAVVKEKDTAFDDDISPGTYASWKKSTNPIPPAGYSNSTTLGYDGGKSKVSFSYEFVWR